jgi:hypothetical protein
MPALEALQVIENGRHRLEAIPLNAVWTAHRFHGMEPYYLPLKLTMAR